jgi:DNA-binding GntR family transcriptional regulator
MPLPQLIAAPALIDQVHDRLLAAICDGSLLPGARVTQESVADMLGVTRQPVSHALQLLKRRGLLVDSGKRGLAVAPIEARRVLALYQVREALDGMAARLAAERVRSSDLSRSELDSLAAALAVGARLDNASTIAELIDADVAFHSAVHRASGNDAIAETVAEVWPHFRRSMGLVLVLQPVRERVWAEHHAIVDAIDTGDAIKAEAAARSHTSRAGAETASRLAGRVAAA